MVETVKKFGNSDDHNIFLGTFYLQILSDGCKEIAPGRC